MVEAIKNKGMVKSDFGAFPKISWKRIFFIWSRALKRILDAECNCRDTRDGNGYMKKGTLCSLKTVEAPWLMRSIALLEQDVFTCDSSKSCSLNVLRARSCPGPRDFPPLHHKKGGLQKKQKFQATEMPWEGKPEC